MQIYVVGKRMAAENTQSIHLTPRAQQLCNALAEAGNWVNRSKLAKLSGKSVLNKWDLVLLNKLIDAGLIETKQIPRHGLINYEWQYRALKGNTGEKIP